MNNDFQSPRGLSNQIRLLSVLDRITQICLGSQDMDYVLRKVLDLVLEVYGADRAWFVYPCDPLAPTWGVPMECTRPNWPGLFALGKNLPMSDAMANLFSEQLIVQGAIQYLPDTDYPVPEDIAHKFSVKSQVIIALHPKIEKVWLFGFHHCEAAKVHDEEDLLLFTRIAHRISDTLSALISFRQLRESASEIQDLYNNAPCGYHSLDKDGVIRQINNTELAWLGYARHEVVNQMKWTDFLEPSQIQRYRDNLGQLIKSGSLQDIEYILIRKDGTKFHGLLSASAIYDANKVFILSRATLTNISPRKMAEQQLHNLTAHLQNVREEEKIGISREIHDELGGTLTAMKIETHWLKTELLGTSNTSIVLGHVEKLSHLIDNAAIAMRNIVTGLRPTMLDDLGLLAALEWQAEQFQKRTGIACRVNCIGNQGDLDKQFSIALFRISQEALTNVMRHSGASRVEIEFHHGEEEVVLSVIDNGCGISMGETEVTACYGILGMRERVKQHGGTISFETPTGGGFIVTVVFKLL